MDTIELEQEKSCENLGKENWLAEGIWIAQWADYPWKYQLTTRMTGTWVIEIVNATPAFKKFGCGFFPEALSSTFPIDNSL